jgi:hypothetical protein
MGALIGFYIFLAALLLLLRGVEHFRDSSQSERRPKLVNSDVEPERPVSDRLKAA